MKVYVRTAAGNEAALNPASALPRKLRTLLISIDGRTRRATYVSSLSSFGDVGALIESLLNAGLIAEAKPQGAAAGGLPDKTTRSPPAGVEKLGGNADTSSAWSNTDIGTTAWRSPDLQTRSFGNEPVDDLASWSKFQQQGAPQAFKLPAAQPATTAHYQLRNAISLMSDFVSKYMPMESLELVLTLEGLFSVEQVVASLQGYESMIAHLGEPARRHMAALRNVLSST